MVQLLLHEFKDHIDIMMIDKFHETVWYRYFIKYGEKDFKSLFLSMLLDRDKLKDPYGLTPLHIAYLLRNRQYRRSDRNGESILTYLLIHQN